MSSDWTRGRRGGAPDDRERGERRGAGGPRRDDGPRERRSDDDRQGWRPFQSPRPNNQERPGGFRDSGRPPFRDRPRQVDEGDRRPPFRDQPREDREFGRDFSQRDERPDRFARPDDRTDRFERPGGRPGGFNRPDDRGDRPFARPQGDRPFRRDQGDDRPTFRQGRGGYRPFDREAREDRPFARDRFERPGGRPGGFNRPDDRGDRPFGRPQGDRPFRRDQDRPPFGGQRQDFQGGQRRREDRPPFEGQGRPWSARPDRGAPAQFERIQADVYGRWPVLEALRAGNAIRIYLAEGVREQTEQLRDIQTAATERHVPVVRVDRFALDKALGDANHQGVAAACRPFQYAGFEDIMAQAKEDEGQPLLVLFDGVQDPQNLGSILRTAEAVGADGAVLPKHHQAGVTPAVVRASAGAVEHLPVAEVTNLRQALDRLKDAGYWIVGLDMEGGTDYDNFDVDSPLAVVIGGEGKGVGRIIADQCDYLVRLPIRGQVGSLNASVAAGIVLYEIDRRRTIGGDRGRRKARKGAAPAAVLEVQEEIDEAPEDLGDPTHDVAVYTQDAGDRDLSLDEPQHQPGGTSQQPAETQQQPEVTHDPRRQPDAPQSQPEALPQQPAEPHSQPERTPQQPETGRE